MTYCEKVIKALEDSLMDKKNQGDYSVRFSFEVVEIIITLLKEQEKVVRCKDCKWYDERISLCDNCGLPREQTFFCADGKMKTET